MNPSSGPTKLLAVAALSLLVLSGCSSDNKSSDKPKPSSSGSPTAVDTSGISPQDMPTPPTVAKAKGAVVALQLGECPTDAGEQTVTGTITSPAKKTVDFLVVINWATAEGDVMGRGFEVLRGVKPGEKRDLSITAKVAKGAERCVPFVQYGTIK
jgi:hypothetical protein